MEAEWVRQAARSRAAVEKLNSIWPMLQLAREALADRPLLLSNATASMVDDAAWLVEAAAEESEREQQELDALIREIQQVRYRRASSKGSSEPRSALRYHKEY
jgi:hypothetical protein